MAQLPLKDLMVLDLTAVVYGPYTTQILGDLGADVIKIEPLRGDDVRHITPTKEGGLSALFMGLNRNKRSICLDLKSESGKDALRHLCRRADFFVHNMRAAKIKALGFGYEYVKTLNPGIIYGELVGYGQNGPWADMPAYDDVIQGQSGLAGSFTARDGTPSLIPSIIADKTSALMAVSALQSALIQKLRTGVGGHLEVPMYETMVAFTMVEQLAGHRFQPPEGRMGYERAVSRFRRAFPTKDGHLCMLAYHDRQWARFFQIIDRPELINDPKFATMLARSENINDVYALVEEVMPTRTTQEWLALLQSAEIACGAVNTLEDLLDDQHLREVNFFQKHIHPHAGEVMYASPPGRWDGKNLPMRLQPPCLGEHTKEVLEQFEVPTNILQEVLDQQKSFGN